MPFDPSIALQAKAPSFNPLQTAMQAAQFNYLNTNTNALQRTVNSNTAQSQAYQGAIDPNTGQFNPNTYMKTIAGDPAAGYNMGAAVTTAQAQTAQGLKNANDQLNWIMTNAGRIANNPDATPNDVRNIVAQAVKTGAIPQSIADQALSDMPDETAPAGSVQKWAANAVAQAAGYQTQLANIKPSYTGINTGPVQSLVNTNPNSATGGAPGTPVATFKNKLTPAQSVTPVSTFTNGQPATISTAQYARNTGQGALVGGGASGPLGTGRYQVNGGVNPTGPVLGSEARANTAATVDVSNGNDLIKAGDAQPGQQTILRQMRADLSNFTSGPTTNSWLALKSLGAAYGIATPEMKESVASQEGFNKLSSNLASAQTAQMGVGTDAKLLTAVTGNPHATLTNLGNAQMINYLLSNSQFLQAKAQAFQAASNRGMSFANFQNQWNQSVTPSVFQYANMTPTQRTTYLKSLSPTERTTFAQQGNFALQNGWIKPGQ